MELEECRKMYEELKEHKAIVANIDTEFFFKFAETVLQALDNSIPKEKVEKKIKEYQHERDKLADGHFWKDANNINQDMSLFIASETLRLLLEE